MVPTAVQPPSVCVCLRHVVTDEESAIFNDETEVIIRFHYGATHVAEEDQVFDNFCLPSGGTHFRHALNLQRGARSGGGLHWKRSDRSSFPTGNDIEEERLGYLRSMHALNSVSFETVGHFRTHLRGNFGAFTLEGKESMTVDQLKFLYNVLGTAAGNAARADGHTGHTESEGDLSAE